jgi:hypothetical protein
MKTIALLAIVLPVLIARADLTIVQKVEAGGTPGEMTIRIKGDKVRVDPAPEVSIITDLKSGDTVTLMHGEKKALRMSGERMKAAAELVSKFAAATPASGRPKLVPTGRKETINGVATDVYSVDTIAGKATYYLAPNYPEAAAILKEMQAMEPEALAHATVNIPDFRDLPGVPMKVEIDGQNHHTVMTLVSIKRDPVPDNTFSVPADYTDMRMPDIFGGKIRSGSAPSPTATP